MAFCALCVFSGKAEDKATFMRYYRIPVMIVMMVVLTSCEAIGDIFSAGIYTGIFVTVVLVAIVIALFVKLGNRK